MAYSQHIHIHPYNSSYLGYFEFYLMSSHNTNNYHSVNAESYCKQIGLVPGFIF